MTTTPTSEQHQTSSSRRPERRSSVAMRIFKHGWWVLLIVVVAGAYYGWGLHRSGAPGRSHGPGQHFAGGPGVMPVGVAVAKTADVPIYLTSLGGVTPIATAAVKSRVNGQLMKLHFQEGQLAKEGELLAEIDPRPYQVAVAQAEGQLAHDMAQLNAAQIDLVRYQTLLEQDSIASQQVDTQAALVKQYEGTVKSDQANLASARLQLNYSRVTAPIGGRLGLRQVDEGNIVDTNSIVTITQLQPITAIFSIAEDYIPSVMRQLRAGKKLPVTAWDREQKHQLAEGVLLTIDNQVDVTTGTVKLKAQFPNTDYALFPNQFVNIRLLLEVRQAMTVVPSAAIQRGAKGLFAYVVKPDNTVTLRNIKAGATQGEVTIVEDGIVTGETVVVDGIDKLREGEKVEAVLRGGADDPANKLTQKSTPRTHPSSDRQASANTRSGSHNSRSK